MRFAYFGTKLSKQLGYRIVINVLIIDLVHFLALIFLSGSRNIVKISHHLAACMQSLRSIVLKLRIDRLLLIIHHLFGNGYFTVTGVYSQCDQFLSYLANLLGTSLGGLNAAVCNQRCCQPRRTAFL